MWLVENSILTLLGAVHSLFPIGTTSCAVVRHPGGSRKGGGKGSE